MVLSSIGVSHSVCNDKSISSRTNTNHNLIDGELNSLSAVTRNKHMMASIVYREQKEDTASLDMKLNDLFDRYKDLNDGNLMTIDGVEKFCSDLDLRPDDFRILIFAWKLNAEQMYQFTRSEFVSGCKTMNVDSIPQIQNRLSELTQLLQDDPQLFRSLYRFAFKFGLDHANGQRILPVDIALCLWRLVFTYNKPPILERWLTFLQNDITRVRGIPRDTWNMFLNFSETVGDDLSTYNDAEAWPSIFDDFVEYENDIPNQNILSSSACSEVLLNSSRKECNNNNEIDTVG